MKITSGTSFDSWSPTFTSDGKYIVYESRGQIWKVRADGAGGKQKIPGSGTGQDAWPKVSATDKIVFCSIDPNGKSFIWTSNLEGGELTQLREGATPSWSPDGKLITFMFDGDVWVINADGTTLIQLQNSYNEAIKV